MHQADGDEEMRGIIATVLVLLTGCVTSKYGPEQRQYSNRILSLLPSNTDVITNRSQYEFELSKLRRMQDAVSADVDRYRDESGANSTVVTGASALGTAALLYCIFSPEPITKSSACLGIAAGSGGVIAWETVEEIGSNLEADERESITQVAFERLLNDLEELNGEQFVFFNFATLCPNNFRPYTEAEKDILPIIRRLSALEDTLLGRWDDEKCREIVGLINDQKNLRKNLELGFYAVPLGKIWQ